jgi:hypothetical protein
MHVYTYYCRGSCMGLGVAAYHLNTHDGHGTHMYYDVDEFGWAYFWMSFVLIFVWGDLAAYT